MKHMKKIISLLAAAAVLFSLAACGKETPAPAVRLSVLSGTTGWGAVQLLEQAEQGKTKQPYTVTVESSVKVIMDALVAGQTDIAAMPTNKAALAAANTKGAVQVLAVNTLGVMSMVCSSKENIGSLEDLAGKTVHMPEEPSYILRALLNAKGIEDVTIETYAAPSDLLALAGSGQVDCAVLPEPLLTAACAKNPDLSIVLDLTEEWDAVFEGRQLMQGCMVVRTEFAKEHPAAVKNFLEEYEASVQAVKAMEEPIPALIEKWFDAAAPVVGKAIPRCNLTFIAGEEMKTSLEQMYLVLADIESAGIGADVPAEEFYYIAK